MSDPGDEMWDHDDYPEDVFGEIFIVSEGELSRALADTILSPDDSFDAQAAKLMATIRKNKGEPALCPRMQLDS